MYLLILESIGTSELLLIGIIALIFLGPRKLPQMARTIGKSMAEFRRTTNEFKSTWEREVDIENIDKDDIKPPAPVARTSAPEPTPTPTPEVRQLSDEEAKRLAESVPAIDQPVSTEPTDSDKRDWL